MPNIIDPVTEPSVLREPSFCMDELDFDALSSPLLQLQGKVDKKPQTAAIILAGGTGERFGKEGGKQLVEIAETFCTAVQDAGLNAMVYANGNFYSKMDLSSLTDMGVDYWYAWYPTVPDLSTYKVHSMTQFHPLIHQFQ